MGENYRVSDELKYQILDRFDKIANKNICKDLHSREKERNDITTTYIEANEHEFKFHDGIWNLILTNVHIRNEYMEMDTDALKVIAVAIDNKGTRKKRNVRTKIRK